MTTVVEAALACSVEAVATGGLADGLSATGVFVVGGHTARLGEPCLKRYLAREIYFLLNPGQPVITPAHTAPPNDNSCRLTCWDANRVPRAHGTLQRSLKGGHRPSSLLAALVVVEEEGSRRSPRSAARRTDLDARRAATTTGDEEWAFGPPGPATGRLLEAADVDSPATS